MRRHLAAAASRIVLRSHARQKHIVNRHADLQAERPVAVVGIEPVIARHQVQRRRHADTLMARAVDLEECFVLALELNFFVVHAARRIHGAIRAQQ